MSRTKHKSMRMQLSMRLTGMKQRCNNPNDTNYKHYGGRGIKVCKEWDEFENFYQWAINSGYSNELQIDRINNDEGYSPENCRWVTAKVNMQNRRKLTPGMKKEEAKTIEINGVMKSISDISEETGISTLTLKNRYRVGQRGDRLIRPLNTSRKEYVNQP